MLGMNTKLIQIRNLTKKYKNVWVFKNLNMEINNTKANLLLAPNGVGKSTLIKCISGFIKYDGIILKNFENDCLCPEKYSFPDYLKIKDIFDFFDIDYEYALKLLKSFKVDENKFACELSKGMHQKILLTIIVTQDMDAYYFDEPLNGLDDESINIFVNELGKLQKRDKLILISTHNPESFSKLSPNIINLRDYIEN